MSPIVFFHGFLGAPEDWAPVVAELANVPCTALPLPIEQDWSTAVQTAVGALPDACHLVGYSMGARLALGCALAAPEQIARMTFISGNPGLENPQQRSQRQAADYRLAAQLRKQPMVEFLTAWYEQPIFADVPKSIRGQWIAQRVGLNQEQQAAILESLTTGNQPNYWPQLSKLTVPCQVIVGQRDHKYVQIGQRMATVTAHGDCCIVPNCGHAVPREQPGFLAKLLADFARSTKTPTHPRGTINE